MRNGEKFAGNFPNIRQTKKKTHPKSALQSLRIKGSGCLKKGVGKKARAFLFAEPLKIAGKERKNAQKNKENRKTKKTRKSKKSKEKGGSGRLLVTFSDASAIFLVTFCCQMNSFCQTPLPDPFCSRVKGNDQSTLSKEETESH